MINLTKEEFDKFMEAQIKEIEKYKWLESEKACKDMGNQACIEWIEKFAKEFSDKYFKEKN